MIKKTVKYIIAAEPTDHIIHHVLMEINGHPEILVLKDYNI